MNSSININNAEPENKAFAKFVKIGQSLPKPSTFPLQNPSTFFELRTILSFCFFFSLRCEFNVLVHWTLVFFRWIAYRVHFVLLLDLSFLCVTSLSSSYSHTTRRRAHPPIRCIQHTLNIVVQFRNKTQKLGGVGRKAASIWWPGISIVSSFRVLSYFLRLCGPFSTDGHWYPCHLPLIHTTTQPGQSVRLDSQKCPSIRTFSPLTR